MRSIEAIQNLVYSAFETMIRKPEMYSPCSVIEFEARLSSYLWMLAISDEQEEAWSEIQEQLQIENDGALPLDIVGSIQKDSASNNDQKNIKLVTEFYADFAQRLGFYGKEQGDGQADEDAKAQQPHF